MNVSQASVDYAQVSSTPTVVHVAEAQPQGNESEQNTLKINEGNAVPQGEQKIARAIEKAEKLPINTTECQFSIHSKTKEVMIKVVDSTTKETIKEIPSEKALDIFVERLEIAGLFVDARK